jgi:hypothetical protein
VELWTTYLKIGRTRTVSSNKTARAAVGGILAVSVTTRSRASRNTALNICSSGAVSSNETAPIASVGCILAKPRPRLSQCQLFQSQGQARLHTVAVQLVVARSWRRAGLDRAKPGQTAEAKAILHRCMITDADLNIGLQIDRVGLRISIKMEYAV